MIIIDDLLFWQPLKGLMAIFEKVHEMAKQELSDESRIKEELLRTQTLYELDQISEEEYLARETEILKRLDQAVKMKSQ